MNGVFIMGYDMPNHHGFHDYTSSIWVLVYDGDNCEIDTFILHDIHPIIKYKLKYKQER
jgi:hypothetical protein